MGYNPKSTQTHCNLADLEKGGLSTIFYSTSLEQEKAEEESLVGLKLGRLGDFGFGLSHSFKGHSASLMDPFSLPSGSAKRARTPNNAGHLVSCLVDGCNSDLSKYRDYHRRHKVCEMHSKTPRVTIGGHEQRFCQQCSRFHSLGEFDEGKRSCRKRLEGHNRRRRKPQPEPLPFNPENFLSTTQGTRFLPFSSQPIISANSGVSTTWSGVVKSESNTPLYSNSGSSSYSNAYRGRQFPFMQIPDSPLTRPPSACQTIHHDGSSSSSNNHNQNQNQNQNQKMLCNGLNQVIDSGRALSLLSSSSPTETPDMGFNRIMHPSPTYPSPRPTTLSGLNFNGFSSYPVSHDQGFHGQTGSSGLLPDVFHGVSDGDGSSSTGANQTLSFSWE